MVAVLAFVPIAAISKGVIVLLVVSTLLLYLFYESYAARGGSLPFVTTIIGRVKRMKEKEIAHAPFLMGGGIAVTVVIFPFHPAAAGLLQLAVSDMAATLVGQVWGKRPLPHAPKKTLEGSLGFFASAFIAMLFLYPFTTSILLALVGTVIESLPYEDWDNFLIPVSVAAVASLY